MSKTERWLDELPLASYERELLLAGKSARPAAGAVDANWQALCVALSSTAAATGVATSSAAANAASAPVGSTVVLSKLASTGLVAASAKSLALGLALGFSVLGAGAVAEHLSGNSEPSTPVAKPGPTPTARRSSTFSPSTQLADQAGRVAVAPPAGPLTDATPGASNARERSPANGPTGNAPAAASAAPAAPPANAASLAQQARELAELKRLIDSGATSEALRRLDRQFSADSASVLSEERDALQVQALERAQRREEARTFARRFLARYPHSPYFETMRRLLAEE